MLALVLMGEKCELQPLIYFLNPAELLAKMKDFPEVNTRTKIVDAGMASYVVRML